MVATLSQSQAELPRLVELASRGEEVIITVEGKPKAKLTRASVLPDSDALATQRADIAKRQRELEALRQKYSTGKTGPTVEQILEEDRIDRV